MTDFLITGATGFVGSHLVEAVARSGARARALVRSTSDTALLERHGVTPVTGSLTDVTSLQRALDDAPVVLHLAAATRALSQAAFDAVNVEGTERLLEAVASAGGRRRVVYVSSMAAVGATRGRPVRPDDTPRPLTPYGRSKLEGERAVLARDDVDGVVLRPPAVYGPRDRDLLPFFRMARWHVLPTAGAPDRPMQFVYAPDLAEGILKAAEPDAPRGVFHIAEPRAYPWSEVLRLVGEAVGRRTAVVRVPDALVRGAAAVSEAMAQRAGRAVIFDRAKARELLAPGWTCETESARLDLGFEAPTPLAKGLRETAEWYGAQGWL